MKGTGTMKELQCPQAKRLFSPYLDGAVTGAEMLALQEHLSDCGACSHEYQALRRTQQLLASVGRPKVPADLGLKVRLALSRETAEARAGPVRGPDGAGGEYAAGVYGSRNGGISERADYFWNRDGVFRGAVHAARG